MSVCNSWSEGGSGRAGNIPVAKLPFQRNFPFFASVPKLFQELPGGEHLMAAPLARNTRAWATDGSRHVSQLEPAFGTAQGWHLPGEVSRCHVTWSFAPTSVFYGWFERRKKKKFHVHFSVLAHQKLVILHQNVL